MSDGADASQGNWIKHWRKEKRVELLEARQAVPSAVHLSISSRIVEELAQSFLGWLKGVTALYVSMCGEPDILPFAGYLLDAGATLALPIVSAPGRPLQFRKWKPGDAMVRGTYGIAYPAAEDAVQPDTLLVPLVGFDNDCYRLGYGGGYYDRTLSVLLPKPLTIGIGMELTRLPTIHPQPHDVPLDFIVTEAGIISRIFQK